MISVTNNALKFFQQGEEKITIYGAGNAGYWVGYYMKRCGMDFECYIDANVSMDEVIYNEKPVIKAERYLREAENNLRIIIPIAAYKEVINDLLWLTDNKHFDILCLVPEYRDSLHGDRRYNINRLLGYFRRKLWTDNIPVFITNDCKGGLLYEILGMPLASPFVNTAVMPEDYIKIAREPEKYLNEQITRFHWERVSVYHGVKYEVPAGELADITVLFPHDKSMEGISDRWNRMRNIDVKNLVFIMDETRTPIPLDIRQEFSRISYKHLFLARNSYMGLDKNEIFLREDTLHIRHEAIENTFDFLNWLQNESSEDNGER